MYETPQAVRDRLDACVPQTIYIIVDGVEGLTHITGADILKDTFTVDRQGFPTGTVFIGEAPAHEIAFTLSNRDGRFDGIRLDGARLSVSIGIPMDEGQTALIPMGVFTVDSAPRRGYGIEVSALDNVALLDRPWVSALTFPATLLQIASEACALCGLTLATTDFLSASYWVQSKPVSKGLTCRRILQWIAQLAGSNVYADQNGQIRIAWLTETGIRITPANRYDSELDDETVTVTGVRFTTTEGTVSFEGKEGYVLNFEDNGLAEFVPLDPAVGVANRMAGFTWRGFTASCRPLPYLWPMDVVTFVDRAGGEHRLVVGSVTYNANGQTLLSCDGISADTSGDAYASGGNGGITASGLEARVLKIESQMADLLYDPIRVTAFSSSVGTVEMGTTVTSVTLSWGFSKPPVTVALDGEEMATDATGTTLTGLSVTASKTWTLTATDERGTEAEDTVSVSFVNGIYYGVAAARSTYDSAFIRGLTRVLQGSKLPSFTVFGAAGTHIYYCLPKRLGTCTFTINGFTGGFTLDATISFTNASGYTETYYVYRSVESLQGTITVSVT